MRGFVASIEKASLVNKNFRQVLYTAKHLQLVVMSIPPGGEIGEETHQLDQFLRVEAGSGVAILDGKERTISDGFAVLVPAGTRHNLKNTGDVDLKLYTLYGPPNHKDGTVHTTKADAEAAEEHFDGATTE